MFFFFIIIIILTIIIRSLKNEHVLLHINATSTDWPLPGRGFLSSYISSYRWVVNNCFPSHITIVFSLKARTFKRKPVGHKPALRNFWLPFFVFFLCSAKVGWLPILFVTATPQICLWVSYSHGILWEGWSWTVLREGNSALLGHTDPCFLRAAGSQQSALTGLRMEPVGLIFTMEFLEHHAWFLFIYFMWITDIYNKLKYKICPNPFTRGKKKPYIDARIGFYFQAWGCFTVLAMLHTCAFFNYSFAAQVKR